MTLVTYSLHKVDRSPQPAHVHSTIQKTAAATERRNDVGSSSTATQGDDVGRNFDAHDVVL